MFVRLSRFLPGARLLLLALLPVALMVGPVAHAATPLVFDPPPVDLDHESSREAGSGDNTSTSDVSASDATAPEASTPDAPAQGGDASPARSPSPASGGASSSVPKTLRLFGMVEFRAPLSNVPKWERVYKLERSTPTFGDKIRERVPQDVADRWQKVRADLEGKSLKEQIQGVNKFFNQWPYKTDMQVWKVEDYWATPAEFMRKSGDCEDYAITKYYALRDLGVPATQLRIVALKDTIRGIGHAILVVFMDNDAYVLDNLSNLILSHTRLTHYQPVFSVNEEYRWAHVKPMK